MAPYTEKDIVLLIQQFKTKTLPKTDWTHRAQMGAKTLRVLKITD